MTKSTRWTAESFLQPVPALAPDWLEEVDDGSVELRLAASLASVYGYYGPSDGKKAFLPLRRQLEPVDTWKTDVGLRARWDFDSKRDVAWTPGHLVYALNAILRRRLVLAVQSGAPTYPDGGRIAASLGDVADFIEGRVDDERLSELLWGCTLLDWSRLRSASVTNGRKARTPLPGAFYALLKLCFAGRSARLDPDELSQASPHAHEQTEVPIVLQIQRLAAAGLGADATREAIRRLRASGIAPAVAAFQVHGPIAARTAASLLFPISRQDEELLTHMIARPKQADTTEQDATMTQSGAIA